MNHSPAIDLSHEFLTLVWGGAAPTDESLLAALDRLVAAYHDAPDGAVSNQDVEAPRQDWPSLYQEVAARFPH